MLGVYDRLLGFVANRLLSFFWLVKGFNCNLPIVTMQCYEQCPEKDRELSYYYD